MRKFLKKLFLLGDDRKSGLILYEQSDELILVSHIYTLLNDKELYDSVKSFIPLLHLIHVEFYTSGWEVLGIDPDIPELEKVETVLVRTRKMKDRQEHLKPLLPGYLVMVEETKGKREVIFSIQSRY